MLSKKSKLFTVLIFGLIMLDGVSVVYSQDVDHGIGAIPDGQTWYTCSKSLTNFVSYTMKMVETSENATPGFGTIVVGNHPKQYDTEGLLTFVANYTQIRNLIDPSGSPVLYLPGISCGTEPVIECGGKTPILPVQEIQCIGIVNPNQHETKFTASISFDASAQEPILVIPPPPDPSPPNSAPSSTSTNDPNETQSFNVNVANRSVIVDFEYLLVISFLFSIFISIVLT